MSTPLTQPHLINRRYSLRAGGFTLTLPLLESLSTKVLGAGRAVGSQRGATVSGQRPMHMVCIGHILGFHQPAFFPQHAGKNHDLPLLMKPMEPVREDFTVFTGLDVRAAAASRARAARRSMRSSPAWRRMTSG